MKKVKSIETYAQYKEKIEQPLYDEVLKSIKASKDKLPASVNAVTKWWWTLITFIIFVLGVAFLALMIVNIKTNTALALGFLGGMVVAFIAMFIMMRYKRHILRKTNSVYRDAMDQDKIFKIASNSFKDVKLLETQENLSPKLFEYRIGGIPSDARVISHSRIFECLYKGKYTFEMQSGKFHWTRTVKTKDGYRKQDYYRTSGYIVLKTGSNEKDFEFSLNTRQWFSDLKKVELENKDFLKKTKFRANDKVKSRMLYTPLAMEETLKHLDNIQLDYNFEKVQGNIICNVATVDSQLQIDAVKASSDDATAKLYVEDIASDFYRMFSVISLAFIPPFL